MIYISPAVPCTVGSCNDIYQSCSTLYCWEIYFRRYINGIDNMGENSFIFHHKCVDKNGPLALPLEFHLQYIYNIVIYYKNILKNCCSGFGLVPRYTTEADTLVNFFCKTTLSLSLRVLIFRHCWVTKFLNFLPFSFHEHCT